MENEPRPDRPDTEPPSPIVVAAEAGPPDVSALARYFIANRAKYTDEALAAEARRQGHSEATIQAALAQSGTSDASPDVRNRALRRILVSYLVTYALLDLGMLLNTRPQGYLMPSPTGGIGILTISLVVAFVISMIWVASRRVFGLLFFVGLILSSIQSVQGILYGGLQYLSPITLIPAAIGAIGLAWLWRSRGGANGAPGFEALLVVPLLILLGVAGICVASGLPIPGGGAT
ncbi:MAG: hypothetical protein AB1736_05305 [Chloroflexota bacterium]